MVINKPAGFHVHPPEKNADKAPRSKIILQQLRDQLNCFVFPVHRLDVPTSGALLFALNSEAAGELNRSLQLPTAKKKYWAIVRGFMEAEGEIDLPLKSDSSSEYLAARTYFRGLHRVEVAKAVGVKHQTSRYSWLEVKIETGRFHQIRRHMNRIAHPVIGDSDHGDSRHNQFFRNEFGISGLCLHCFELHFEFRGRGYKVFAQPPSKWEKICDLFQIKSYPSG